MEVSLERWKTLPLSGGLNCAAVDGKEPPEDCSAGPGKPIGLSAHWLSIQIDDSSKIDVRKIDGVGIVRMKFLRSQCPDLLCVTWENVVPVYRKGANVEDERKSGTLDRMMPVLAG